MVFAEALSACAATKFVSQISLNEEQSSIFEKNVF
jgi:hypothetical protein